MDTKEKVAVVGIVAATITGWRSELKPFAIWFWDGLTPWRFIFVISVGYLVWWWIDRRALKRKDWLRESKAATDLAIAGSLSDLNAVITANERALAVNRTEWANQLREMIEEAVEYKANLATVQLEAKERTEADAAINRRLDEIIDRLPPVESA
jgi:hypothetical protein